MDVCVYVCVCLREHPRFSKKNEKIRVNERKDWVVQGPLDVLNKEGVARRNDAFTMPLW